MSAKAPRQEAGTDRLARAERKLAALKAELEVTRTQYREAERQGASRAELRAIEGKGRELAGRVEEGRAWLARERAGGRTAR